jgi:hypothetical protein
MLNIKETVKEFEYHDRIFLFGLLFCLSSAVFIHFRVKNWFMYVCVGLIYICFNLDLKFALKIEGKSPDEKVLRIDSKALLLHPYKEIGRYIETVLNFNNRGRASMGISAIILLFLYPVIDKQYLNILPCILLVIYTVVKNYWDWKEHHSTLFMHRSVLKVCEHMSSKDKNLLFRQVVHI